MPFRFTILCFWLINAFSTIGQPQQFRFVNFNAKDGLADKYVYCAEQDNSGYMWFGAATGLYRYDGHSFKQFRSSANQPGRTIANVLQAVAKDESGNLWLGSINTLQWYDPVRNRFWHPNHSSKLVQQMEDAIIQFISRGSNGRMWVCTNKNYFFRFNPSDSSFTHFKTYPAGSSRSVLQVFEYNDELYAVQAEGIFCFSKSGKFIGSYKTPASDVAQGMFDEKEQCILLSTYNHGVLRFKLKTKQYDDAFPYNERLKQYIILCIEKTSDGNYFAGGYPLHYINVQNNQYYYFAPSKQDFHLGNTKIVSVFTDREKNLWFCSHSGLSMLPWQNRQIKKIVLSESLNTGTIEPAQVFLSPGTNDLLITNTSTNGLLVLNTVSGAKEIVVNPAGTGITEKRISSLITAPDSSIFLSDNIHFYKYRSQQRKMIPYTLTDQYGKPIVNAGQSVFDKDGNIYITCKKNGFYTWQYPDGKLTHFNRQDIDKTVKPGDDNKIIPCLVDSKNNCWFSSSNGVYKYNRPTNNYDHIGNKQQNETPLMGVTVGIAEDKQHHIWITTEANGLYEWYEENGKEVLNNYTSASGIGLPSDFCWTIQQSPVDSMLWISNVPGILRFDPVRKKVVSLISQQNGFADDDGGYTFHIFPDGVFAQLYYNHLNLFDLKTYRYNEIKPVVQIQSAKAMDKEFAHAILGKNAILELAANQNFLQFEFAALVFNNANRNQYTWMLEGADKDWISGGSENKVTYSGLKPGSYTFRVKAANNDGVWGDETIVKIIIRPPFYATWWFIACCAALAAAGFYSWNRFRVKQVRREEELKAQFQQEIAETEMKALRAQMNPHFIFNSLNSIQKYILKNEHFEASQYLTKFSRLIRLILDHSNQNTITISSEMDLLKLYAEMESLRFNNRFEYSIEKDLNVNAEITEIPSMLIQPYVENAIWHGLLHKEEKGKLIVHFAMKDEKNLQVTIEDNGIGREKAAGLKSKQVLKKKSYGMQITEDRIAVINRLQNINATSKVDDLKNEMGEATGTRITLHIPLKTKNLSS